jgi:glycerol-3-phosphate acyltransferase PlsY
MPPGFSTAILIAGSYLLGSAPFGLLIGLARGVDIRQTGSRNIGATNLTRALGRPWGLIAFALDFAKGLVPVLIARYIESSHPTTVPPSLAGWLAVSCGLAATVGHVFPLFLRFRGGKGVATSFGALAGLAWLPTVLGGGLWLLLYVLTRTVSLASVTAGTAVPLLVAGLEREAKGYVSVQVFAVLVATLIVVRHRSNIGRLLRGEEFSFGPGPRRKNAKER